MWGAWGSCMVGYLVSDRDLMMIVWNYCSLDVVTILSLSFPVDEAYNTFLVHSVVADIADDSRSS